MAVMDLHRGQNITERLEEPESFSTTLCNVPSLYPFSLNILIPCSTPQASEGDFHLKKQRVREACSLSKENNRIAHRRRERTDTEKESYLFSVTMKIVKAKVIFFRINFYESRWMNFLVSSNACL